MRLLLIMMSLFLTGCVSVEQLTFVPGSDGVRSEEELSKKNIESVQIETSDGENIHALFLPNDKSNILTIYFHGNGGNIHQRADVLDNLRSLGSSVLAVSYRGYLHSSGTPSEQGIFKDGKAALDYATTKLAYTKEKIVLLGRSLGSSVAIDLAKDESVGGVILVSPFTNPRDMLKSQGMLLRLLVKDNNNFLDTAFQNSKKAGKINSYTLVVHGNADEVVPYGHGKRIHELLSGEKKLLTLDGATHNNFGYSDASEFDKQYWSAISDLYQRVF